MPKKSRNVYTTLKGTESTLLTVTRRDGSSVCAFVDTEDVPLVSQYTWCVLEARPRVLYLYAKTGWPKQYNVMLHRVILGLESGDPRQGDHINWDTLDCRKSNLRIVTKAENSVRRRLGDNASRNNVRTGVRNVVPEGNKFAVTVAGKYYGLYDSLAEAARVASAVRQELTAAKLKK